MDPPPPPPPPPNRPRGYSGNYGRYNQQGYMPSDFHFQGNQGPTMGNQRHGPQQGYDRFAAPPRSFGARGAPNFGAPSNHQHHQGLSYQTGRKRAYEEEYEESQGPKRPRLEGNVGNRTYVARANGLAFGFENEACGNCSSLSHQGMDCRGPVEEDGMIHVCTACNTGRLNNTGLGGNRPAHTVDQCIRVGNKVQKRVPNLIYYTITCRVGKPRVKCSVSVEHLMDTHHYRAKPVTGTPMGIEEAKAWSKSKGYETFDYAGETALRHSKKPPQLPKAPKVRNWNRQGFNQGGQFGSGFQGQLPSRDQASGHYPGPYDDQYDDQYYDQYYDQYDDHYPGQYPGQNDDQYDDQHSGQFQRGMDEVNWAFDQRRQRSFEQPASQHHGFSAIDMAPHEVNNAVSAIVKEEVTCPSADHLPQVSIKQEYPPSSTPIKQESLPMQFMVIGDGDDVGLKVPGQRGSGQYQFENQTGYGTPKTQRLRVPTGYGAFEGYVEEVPSRSGVQAAYPDQMSRFDSESKGSEYSSHYAQDESILLGSQASFGSNRRQLVGPGTSAPRPHSTYQTQYPGGPQTRGWRGPPKPEKRY